jgi:hypothetical protein
MFLSSIYSADLNARSWEDTKYEVPRQDSPPSPHDLAPNKISRILILKSGVEVHAVGSSICPAQPWRTLPALAHSGRRNWRSFSSHCTALSYLNTRDVWFRAKTRVAGYMLRRYDGPHDLTWHLSNFYLVTQESLRS